MSNFIEIEVITNSGEIHGKILINLDCIDTILEEDNDKFGKITILKMRGMSTSEMPAIRSITPYSSIKNNLRIVLH